MGGWDLKLVRRPSQQRTFQVLPRRGVVERAFGWLNLQRRLSKDYEALCETTETWLYISMTGLMLRRRGCVHTNCAEMLSCPHGDYLSSVRTDYIGPARSARQRQTVELASPQRDPVCRRAGLQVAGVAGSLRQLAYRLHQDEPLVEEWGAGPGVGTPAAGTDRAHQTRSGSAGQHHGQGPPRRHGCAKKTGLSPSESPGAAGPPRFIWLPRMLEPP